NWLERPKDMTPQALRADLQLLDEMHRQLRDAVAALSPRQLDGPSAQRGVSRRALVTGIAAHDLYHAGQIQLLKRLSGTSDAASSRTGSGGVESGARGKGVSSGTATRRAGAVRG